MIKYKKIFFLIFIPILLFSCGYQPMFKDLKNLNFVLKINNSSGNEKINRLIKSKLKGYSNQNNNENYKKYDVEFISKYQKLIVAKDTTGTATEYKISIEAKFKITSGEFKKEFKYIESFNMKSFNDRIEEQDYEKNIQNSLANIISKKLILQLSQIK
jgi:hypothetical protein